MTIEEVLREARLQTAENGFAYAVLPSTGGNGSGPQLERPLEKMVSAVPRALMPRLGRSACYFVPWLYKQKRTVAVGTTAAETDETRKELCHHLDIKPQGNLLLIGLNFYEHDSYGLAMEFFDKVAYIASLERAGQEDFYDLLKRQVAEPNSGELTPDAWEWRGDTKGETAGERWRGYERAAESDVLGVYMASLYTDVFYEDLFEAEQNFPSLSPEMTYERMRIMERLFPPNRGYSFQVVRQRARRGAR